jgi:glutathione S-transferase
MLLYHFALSIAAHKVRVVLAEKDLSWESREINLVALDSYRPEYVWINPKATVPTLIHEDKILKDATEIARYLDLRFPAIPMMPQEPRDAQRVEEWLTIQAQIPIRVLTYGNLKGPTGQFARSSFERRIGFCRRFQRENPLLKEAYDAKIADIESWRDQARDRAYVEKCNTDTVDILRKLEDDLSPGPWLGGDCFSLADALFGSVLYRLKEIGFDKHWKNGSLPRVTDYIQRLEARPSFRQAIPDYETPLIKAKIFAPVLGPRIAAGIGVLAFLWFLFWRP